MRLALPWFEEFAGEMTLSAVLLPELDLPPDSTSVKVQIEGGPRARIYDRRGQCLIEEVDLARFLPSLEPEFRIAWQRLIPSHGERFEAWIDGELEVPRTGYALAWRVVYGSRLPYAPL